MAVHQAAGAAGAEVRVGHLRGRRQYPAAHPRHGDTDRAGDRLVPAAHLTCVGATREGVDEVARQYWEAGVRHIVALRGDAPAGENYQPHPRAIRMRWTSLLG